MASAVTHSPSSSISLIFLSMSLASTSPPLSTLALQPAGGGGVVVVWWWCGGGAGGGGGVCGVCWGGASNEAGVRAAHRASMRCSTVRVDRTERGRGTVRMGGTVHYRLTIGAVARCGDAAR